MIELLSGILYFIKTHPKLQTFKYIFICRVARGRRWIWFIQLQLINSPRPSFLSQPARLHAFTSFTVCQVDLMTNVRLSLRPWGLKHFWPEPSLRKKHQFHLMYSSKVPACLRSGMKLIIHIDYMAPNLIGYVVTIFWASANVIRDTNNTSKNSSQFTHAVVLGALSSTF